jgi:hypothetical protein
METAEPVPKPKYKVCKTCGNRNHPASGQCAGCGARLPRPIDRVSALGAVLIILIFVGLIVYSVQSRSLAGTKARPASASGPGE